MVYLENVILHICDSTNVPNNKDGSHQCNAEQKNLKSQHKIHAVRLYLYYVPNGETNSW